MRARGTRRRARRAREDTSDAEVIDVRPSCAGIERVSRAEPAEERAKHRLGGVVGASLLCDQSLR